jgi:hypothetical protein
LQAADVEYAYLHQAACEFDTYDPVLRMIERKTKSSPVQSPFQIARFADNAEIDEFRGDFRDGGWRKAQGVGDVGA